MEHIYDLVIIGGGPAGYSAALYAARAGISTIVAEQTVPGGQLLLTDRIYNYPGFDDGIDGTELGMRMKNGAEKYGAKTVYAKVISVDFSGSIKKITTADGVLYGKTVLIATGASARRLGLKGESELTGKGVHYCAHCDGRFYKGRTVAVAGGGNSAVWDALYLSQLAAQVYIIHRRDTFRATENVDKIRCCDNITAVMSCTIEEIIYDSVLKGVIVKNTDNGDISRISCDGLFVSVGRKPAVDFLGNAVSCDENGYIIAGEDAITDIKGVFAAGDVRRKKLRQIVTAAADGACAVDSVLQYLRSGGSQ